MMVEVIHNDFPLAQAFTPGLVRLRLIIEPIHGLSQSHQVALKQLCQKPPKGVCRNNRISPCKLRDLRVFVLKFLRKECTTEITEKPFSDRLLKEAHEKYPLLDSPA